MGKHEWSKENLHCLQELWRDPFWQESTILQHRLQYPDCPRSDPADVKIEQTKRRKIKVKSDQSINFVYGSWERERETDPTQLNGCRVYFIYDTYKIINAKKICFILSNVWQFNLEYPEAKKHVYRSMYIIFKISSEKHQFSIANNAFLYAQTLDSILFTSLKFSKTHAC